MTNVASLLGVPGVDSDLNRIEEAVARALRSEDPFLDQVVGHIIAAGGKRLRPALAVAAARAGSGDPDLAPADDVIQAGVSVELIHTGSLYHDDVMDQAATRHGVESVNHRWGDFVAILGGDFLLAKASEIAAGLGTEVAALMASTIARLCEGQIRELQTLWDVDRTEEAYFASIGAKTAALYSASCRAGALAAGLDRSVVDAVTEFGERFGFVFQIYDDILDVVATEDELGKPVGSDMACGVYTLPALRALRDDDASGELRALLGRPLDGPEREKARDIVRRSSGLAQALGAGRREADAAAAALAPVPGAAAATLGGLGHRLLDNLGL